MLAVYTQFRDKRFPITSIGKHNETVITIDNNSYMNFTIMYQFLIKLQLVC